MKSNMNRRSAAMLAILMICASMIVRGETYLSNLSIPSAFPPIPVYPNGWAGQRFRTGNSPAGYELNWIQFAMDTTIGSPGGFYAYLYDTSVRAGGKPDQEVGSFVGIAPSSAGVYTFHPSGPVLLAPSTDYFAVVHASPPGTGSYRWKQASSGGYEALGGWQMDLNQYISGDGLNWGRVDILPCQFAIGATCIPEPSALALLGLSGAIFLAIQCFLLRK